MQPGSLPDDDPSGQPSQPPPEQLRPGQPPQEPIDPQPHQAGPPVPPGGYEAPPDSPPAVGGRENTIGLLGMIFGIVAIPAACCALLGVLLGAAGIVLGSIGMKRASEGRATNRGMAITGVICGAVAIVLSIVLAVVWVASDITMNVN